MIAAGVYSDKVVTADFGQHGFAYTPPTGFKSICSNNIAPTSPNINPKKHFDILTWTGNGSNGHVITGLEFQPDLIWGKCRSNGHDHQWIDSIRGTTKYLASNRTDEATASDRITSINNNGFTLGSDARLNENSRTNVAWCWKAGGAAVSNSDGSITSSVSANQEAGFSIVSFTGTGANATVGHGLGVAPSVIVVRNRVDSEPWWVYHISIGAGGQFRLNASNAEGTDGNVIWNSTAPTSTVFSLGTNNGANGSSDAMMAYCWAEIPGYSKFGSYYGNNDANGQYVYMGFRPAWILIKRSSSESWVMGDIKRNSNAGRRTPADSYILADGSGAEATGIIYDFLSDGIKFGSNSQNEASVYYYWAYAEQPGATPFGTDVNAG